jgi:DNA modification methylase
MSDELREVLDGTRRWCVECGDVRTVLGGMADDSFHGCLCDPPYGLAFMGKAWDSSLPTVETARKRLARWDEVPANVDPSEAETEEPLAGQVPLFPASGR